MEELKLIIAENMINLRKSAGFSQAELGDKLGYTDKAVSKWERGESIPDIYTLKQLTGLYGVSIDYITTRHENQTVNISSRTNKKTIMILSVAGVFLAATVVFVALNLFGIHRFTWMSFIYALPLSSLLLMILGCVFCKNRRKVVRIFLSAFVWTVLLSLYLSFLKSRVWLLFIIGAPAQVVIILSTLIRKGKNL